jgi:hypothetical protein
MSAPKVAPSPRAVEAENVRPAVAPSRSPQQPKTKSPAPDTPALVTGFTVLVPVEIAVPDWSSVGVPVNPEISAWLTSYRVLTEITKAGPVVVSPDATLYQISVWQVVPFVIVGPFVQPAVPVTVALPR